MKFEIVQSDRLLIFSQNPVFALATLKFHLLQMTVINLMLRKYSLFITICQRLHQTHVMKHMFSFQLCYESAGRLWGKYGNSSNRKRLRAT